MIAVDTNILVYAHRPEPSLHAAALTLMRNLCEGTDAWGIPVHCLVEFAAVASNRKIWRMPSAPTDIDRQLRAWTQSPSFFAIEESVLAVEQLTALMAKHSVHGGQVHDARIIAACAAGGVSTLYTVDRDFSRYQFPTENPLSHG